MTYGAARRTAVLARNGEQHRNEGWRSSLNTDLFGSPVLGFYACQFIHLNDGTSKAPHCSAEWFAFGAHSIICLEWSGFCWKDSKTDFVTSALKLPNYPHNSYHIIRARAPNCAVKYETRRADGVRFSRLRSATRDLCQCLRRLEILTWERLCDGLVSFHLYSSQARSEIAFSVLFFVCLLCIQMCADASVIHSSLYFDAVHCD